MGEVPGWAPVAEREAGNLAVPEQPEIPNEEELIEFEKNLLLAPLVANELLRESRDLLVELVNEMKKANAMVTGDAVAFTPIEARGEVEFDVPVPEIPSAPEEEPRVPMPKMETEQEIVDYYKGKLLVFEGWDFKKDNFIERVNFGIEESRVIMTIPFMQGVPFGDWIRYIENEMGGTYEKEARQYVLPKP